MSEVKRYWIYKGTSNFCQVLIMNDDYTDMVKQKPDGFYDIVSTNDTVEGGVEVVLASEYEKLKAQLERAEEVINFYSEEKNYKRSFNDELGPVLLNEFLKPIWAKIVNDCGTMAREYFKEKESK